MAESPIPLDNATELRAPGKIVVWLLVFLPAFLCAYQIAENAVDVPVWDDWERTQLLERHYAGELDLEFLASAHIDHRPLVPRLLTVLLNDLTGGDLRAEMWLGFFAVAVAALLLAALVVCALPDGPWRWGTVFCLNLFLFSPVQYQNFLWGTQMAYLLPSMFLCVALWAMATPRLTAAGKLVTGSGAAALATFCFGHGLIVWPVVVCMALLVRDGRGFGRRALLAGGLVLVAAAVVGIYFNWNYVNTSHPAHAFGTNPGERPPGIRNLDQTLGTAVGRDKVERYFLTSLGNPYARVFQSDPSAAAPMLGFGALVLFCGVALWCFWPKRGRDDFNAALPWLAAGGFAISNAFLQSLGRAAISADRAILPRYISSAHFLGLALVGGGALLLHRWANAAADEVARARRGGVALSLGLALAALHVPSWDYGVHKMVAWRGARLEEQFALSYMKLRRPDAVSRIDKETAMPLIERGLALMVEHDLLSFPVLDEWGWGDIRPSRRELPKSRAEVWRAVVVGDDLLAIEGWAEFGGDGNRAADGIALTYRTAPGGPWKVFGVAETHPLMATRSWIADGHFGAPKPSFSKIKNAAPWGGGAAWPLPQTGEVEVKVWAVDMAKREAIALQTRFEIDRGALAPGAVLVDRGRPVAVAGDDE